MTSAKNRAIDVFRRERTARKFAPELQQSIEIDWTVGPSVAELFLPEALRDDELRMMFSCCQPRLKEDVQIALILKNLCGLSVDCLLYTSDGSRYLHGPLGPVSLLAALWQGRSR